ncbi:MAG TPA: hypothetical protein VJK05_01290 [archaeon]|nr:hypothetical protein [archaeon]
MGFLDYLFQDKRVRQKLNEKPENIREFELVQFVREIQKSVGESFERFEINDKAAFVSESGSIYITIPTNYFTEMNRMHFDNIPLKKGAVEDERVWFNRTPVRVDHFANIIKVLGDDYKLFSNKDKTDKLLIESSNANIFLEPFL